jgi:hypothetical protein
MTTATKTAKKLDVAALLKASAKAPAGKASSPFDYDGDLKEPAARFLAIKAQVDELGREEGLVRDEIRRVVDPWYQGRLRDHKYESSVKVGAGDGASLRVTYSRRCTKLPASKEDELRGILGDEYDRFFRPVAKVALKKAVAEDPDRLAEVVTELAEALGADKFSAIFDVEQTIEPSDAFAELRYRELDGETNSKLELAGVKQIVAFGQGK